MSHLRGRNVSVQIVYFSGLKYSLIDSILLGKSDRIVLVDSSAISSISYDPQSLTLDIEFKSSGEIYRYFDVPNDEYSWIAGCSLKRGLSEFRNQTEI